MELSVSAPTPDASTPEGRFLIAYGSYQHARMTAGFSVMAAPPAQVLALVTHMVHWTVELDQVWEQLEGTTYTSVRDAHAARGVLSALRVVRERVGVLSAVVLTENGPMWRPSQDLALGPVDQEVYTQHLAEQSVFDEASVLDLFINGSGLDGGLGRESIAQAQSPRWTAGDEAPHESDQEEEKVLADAMDEIKMLSTHTPEEIESYHAERGGYFLTLVVGDADVENPSPGQVDGPLGAWYALMRQLSGGNYPSMTMGGSSPTYLFKGEHARNTVRELAQVARVLDPGHWEVVEGYRRPKETEETDPRQL
ncbi:hypothetical protein ADL05_18470 [Nocardiopsis sp. NRRL B-16309]|nr:hypothetical protein ADL05_18470 [Nocardiopsis sp. NRRL B-16309]